MYVYTKCYLQQHEVAQLKKTFLKNLSTYHTLNLAYWLPVICYLKMLFSGLIKTPPPKKALKWLARCKACKIFCKACKVQGSKKTKVSTRCKVARLARFTGLQGLQDYQVYKLTRLARTTTYCSHYSPYRDPQLKIININY